VVSITPDVAVVGVLLVSMVIMTSSLSWGWVLSLELNADSSSSPAALYFECWLDTELANTDKERSVVVVKGVLLLLSNSIQS
jgi:hypothetical protein